jgi:putative multicomponent Na+:H+ antiporter subunit B
MATEVAMTDSYVYLIMALLPLSAFMVIFQANPYHALIMRGILGAMAALLYTVLGAADVALTEALVGTLLAITLYAIAVRSSMVLRLGILKTEMPPESEVAQTPMASDRQMPIQMPSWGNSFQLVANELRQVFAKHYMQVEVLPYDSPKALEQALVTKEIHATCARLTEKESFLTTTRLDRIHRILQTEWASPLANLALVSVPDLPTPENNSLDTSAFAIEAHQGDTTANPMETKS